MTYRHATNLRVPFGRTDLALLALLLDYRLGEPVPADKKKVPTALPKEGLLAQNVVGLYIDPKVLSDPLFQRYTGWTNPNMLGQDWRPVGS